MTSKSDESESPSELTPLPGGDGTAPLGAGPAEAPHAEDAQDTEDTEDTGASNGAELLDILDEPPDLDDSNATELESGIELEEAEAEPGGDDGLAVDIGDVLHGRESAPHLDDEAEDAVATADLFGDRTIGTFPSDDVDDTTSEDGFEDLLDEALPGLDADDGEEPAVADALFDTALLTGEELPRRAELMWGEILPMAAEPPRTIVRTAGSGAVIFGRDVTLVEESGSRRLLAKVSGTVRSAVVEPGFVFYATSAGALCRVASGQGAVAAPEPLVAYREAVASAGQSPELTLGGPTPSARPALLLHVGGATRALLESTDHGKTWRRVELKGSVLALSAGTPPACLVATERGTRLLRSEPSGGFAAVGAPWSADAEVPTMATAGDVMLVMEPGAPLRVSADGGATFLVAPRTALATAITAGRLGGRPWGFAALFEPTSGRAALVSIDATTAEAFVIGYLEPEGDEGDEEHYRVASLAWDENEETLHAVGEFGLARFRRPPSA